MDRALLYIRPHEVTPALTALFAADEPAGIRLFAVLEGRMAGRIVTDDLASPNWGIVQETMDGSIYLGGALDSALIGGIISAFRVDGEALVGLWPDDPRRELLPRNPDYLGSVFDFLNRIPDGDRLIRLTQQLPDGCRLQGIDRALIERCAQRDHVIARYGSLDGFFAYGLGYCLMQGDDILSEAYAGPTVRGTMEVGIYTDQAHRRKGYATYASAQVIATCEARGYQTYWNTNTSNLASAALARKLGYQTEKVYSLVAWDKKERQTDGSC